MRLWLRVRRAPACSLAVAVAAISIVPLGGLVVSLPALGSMEALAIPLATLMPMVVIVVLAWGLASGDWQLEAVSCRPIPRHDTLYVLGWASVAAVAFSATEVLALDGNGYAAARNAIGLAGLLLIGRRVGGGTVGPLVPALFVVVVAAFGGDSAGDPWWWAWLVAGGTDPLSWILAVLAAILGAAVSLNGAYPLVGHY